MMRQRIVYSVTAVLFLLSLRGESSLEGIPKDYPIRGTSRPCCGFAPSFFTRLTGTSAFADPSALGSHDFGRLIATGKVARQAHHQEETYGQVFTCEAGFLDLAHLRDTADWSATVYRTLLGKLGTGAVAPITREGGISKIELVLPKMTPGQLARISTDELQSIAVALTFDLALYHEIATAFAMSVSRINIPFMGERVVQVPFGELIATERVSSFSVEDSFSNLLGAHLGMAAARSPLPFNEAMTQILNETLDRYGVQSRDDTLQVVESLKGDWWVDGFVKGYRQVQKRSYGFMGQLRPERPATSVARKLCGKNTGSNNDVSLEVPSIEAITRESHKSIVFVRVYPNARYRRELNKLGVMLNPDGSFTRDQFPPAISAIRKHHSRVLPVSR